MWGQQPRLRYDGPGWVILGRFLRSLSHHFPVCKVGAMWSPLTGWGASGGAWGVLLVLEVNVARQ